MSPSFVALLILLILQSRVGSGASSPSGHLYNVGDHVPLFVNRVGPLDNPSETYHYYDFPFCLPDPLIEKKLSLGEVLNGDRLMSSLYQLKFREDKTQVVLCRKKLKPTEISRFRDAVINEFYFQMYYDDLPLWGYVGKIEREDLSLREKVTKYYLFRHVQFDVLYNGDRVIEIRAFSDPNFIVDISEDVEIDVAFTYSVLWNSTMDQFEIRMDKYSRASSHPASQHIHFFSFINSIAVVALLAVLLIVLLMHHLKNDLKKCSSGDEEENKDVTWKRIQGDVFRCPKNLFLLCAVLGTGTQFLILVCVLFVLAIFGFLYPYNRGALFTSAFISYVLTSTVSGYTAASFHSQFAGNGLEKSVRLAGILFPGPFFLIVSILNAISISYGTTSAPPFGTILLILFLYTLVNIPFLMLGGVLGYHFRTEFQAPSSIKRHPREIPPQNWYRRTAYQIFLGGFVSFSAILPELNQFYKTIWGYKIYTTPGDLFLTFVILVLLSAILGVLLTYIQLSGEDHRWWWRSIFCGGSTAIFMFAYCIFFYFRSNMKGFLQMCFYFGYNACFCYAVFMMLGSISFCASWLFIRLIYRSVKSE